MRFSTCSVYSQYVRYFLRVSVVFVGVVCFERFGRVCALILFMENFERKARSQGQTIFGSFQLDVRL